MVTTITNPTSQGLVIITIEILSLEQIETTIITTHSLVITIIITIPTITTTIEEMESITILELRECPMLIIDDLRTSSYIVSNSSSTDPEFELPSLGSLKVFFPLSSEFSTCNFLFSCSFFSKSSLAFLTSSLAFLASS